MSTFLEFTESELELLGVDTSSEKYKCLVAYAKYSDESQSNASLLRGYISRIHNRMPLSDLTGAEEEWETVDGVVRNKRCHRVVKEGDVCYDKEAIVFYTLDESGNPIKSITEDSKVLIEFPYRVKTIYQELEV